MLSIEYNAAYITIDIYMCTLLIYILILNMGYVWPFIGILLDPSVNQTCIR